MDTFKATQQHSHCYKDPYPYKDKVVVLVGIGNSAVDIATEVSRWAKSVYLVTRRSSVHHLSTHHETSYSCGWCDDTRGAWVLPKYLFGMPTDHTVSRCVAVKP